MKVYISHPNATFSFLFRSFIHFSSKFEENFRVIFTKETSCYLSCRQRACAKDILGIEFQKRRTRKAAAPSSRYRFEINIYRLFTPLRILSLITLRYQLDCRENRFCSHTCAGYRFAYTKVESAVSIPWRRAVAVLLFPIKIYTL